MFSLWKDKQKPIQRNLLLKLSAHEALALTSSIPQLVIVFHERTGRIFNPATRTHLHVKREGVGRRYQSALG